MKTADLIAQARRLADNDHLSQPPGAPESSVAWTLRALADELERLDLKWLRARGGI